MTNVKSLITNESLQITEREDNTERTIECETSPPTLRDVKPQTEQRDISEKQKTEKNTVYTRVSENLNLKLVEKAEEMVKNFRNNYEAYAEKAKFALTKKEEKDLVDLIYKEINKIDNVIGIFEVQLNNTIELEVDHWIHKNVKKLERSMLT